MPEETPNCARIFISYAHKDQREHWLDRVLEHLGALCHQGLIAPFEDRMIAIGDEWDETIRRKLDESDLIVFLVSPSFLNSPYCNRVEVKRALERHRAGEAKVMPIIVRPCDWEDSAFAAVQAFPRPGPDGLVPLSSWRPDADEPLAKIAREIRLWAKDFIEKKVRGQKPGRSGGGGA